MMKSPFIGCSLKKTSGRAGTTTDHHTGDGAAALREAGSDDENCESETQAVRKKARNGFRVCLVRSPFVQKYRQWHGTSYDRFPMAAPHKRAAPACATRNSLERNFGADAAALARTALVAAGPRSAFRQKAPTGPGPRGRRRSSRGLPFARRRLPCRGRHRRRSGRW